MSQPGGAAASAASNPKASNPKASNPQPTNLKPSDAPSEQPVAAVPMPSGPARVLALVAVGLAFVIYLLGFLDDFGPAGLVAVPLVLGGGLLTGAAVLPTARRLLVPGAVVATTGALVLLQFAIAGSTISVVPIIIIVLAFLLAGATVGSALLDIGLVTLPEPRPRNRRGQPAAGYGYGRAPGYGYGQFPDQGGYGQPGYPAPGTYGPPPAGGYGRPPYPGATAQQQPYHLGDQTVAYPGSAPYGQQPRPDTGGVPDWYSRPDPPAPSTEVPPTSPPEQVVAPSDPTIVPGLLDLPPPPEPRPAPEVRPAGTGDDALNEETRIISPQDRPPA